MSEEVEFLDTVYRVYSHKLKLTQRFDNLDDAINFAQLLRNKNCDLSIDVYVETLVVGW